MESVSEVCDADAAGAAALGGSFSNQPAVGTGDAAQTTEAAAPDPSSTNLSSGTAPIPQKDNTWQLCCLYGSASP